MKELFKKIQVLIISVFMLTNVNAQYCDSSVPSLPVDLSASPNMSWQSLSYSRDGSCCGSVAPDVCTEFVITLHPDAIAVEFNIVSGAIPPGALFYQIDCGPITLVGDPICLTGVGPHNLTFCKPGNNPNAFSITSYSNPVIGPDITLNAACQGFIHANFYNEPSMSWTSIAPGVPGAYDSYLSCLAGCDTTYVTAPVNAPAYVDYLVCGMDLPGCNPNSICDTIRVTFVPPVTVTVSPDITVCPDVTSVQLVAQASGGTGPYSILWSTAETNDTINVGPGIYTVQVTDASGCHIATANTTVSIYPLPNVDAGLDQTICVGPMVTLSASGAVSYVWDNGVFDGISFVPNMGTTTYTVTGTDVNGCFNTDQVDVTINPLPTVNAGIDQTMCDGVQVTLSGSGAASYTWNNGVIDGVAFNAPIGITTYTVTGTDVNGCVNTDQVDVTVNPLPIVVAGIDQTVCDGVQTTLSGSGAVSYTWNNGVIDGIAFNSPIGITNYIVTGTDANGCQNTDNLNVTVNALPIIVANALDISVCDGQSATLTGSGGTSYMWDNAVLDGVSFIPPAGVTTYTVTGTDVNGCVNTDQIDITVYNLPAVVAGLDQTMCDGVQVTLSGSGAVSYAWNNGVIDGVAFNSPIGTTNYTVIGTDGNGCTNTDNVDVIVNSLPIVVAGIDQTVCDGVQTTLSGSGAVSYTWNNGVIDGIAFNSPIGTTNYIVSGTDANGCQNTDNLNVTVNALPNVNAGVDIQICDGGSIVLAANGAIVYSWTGGVIDNVAFTPFVGQYQYVVTGTDINGCVNTDAIDVTVNPNPVVNAGSDQTLCENDFITLNAAGTNNLYWNNGVINNVPFQQVVGVTTYVVYDSYATGCSASDTVQIEVYANPIVFTSDVEICEGESVILTGNGALTYEWSNGILDGFEFYPFESAVFTVTGYNAEGCSSTADALVSVNMSPIANFTWTNTELSTNNPTTGFNNLSIGGVSFLWDFNDFTPNSSSFEPTHTFPIEEGNGYAVTLTVTSSAGCVAEIQQYVDVKQDYSIYVPNTFTPDANGVNEIFNPILVGFDEQDYTLYIFNRWGQLVFESHDMSTGWNGTYAAGQFDNVQDGAFTWKVIARVKNTADTKQFVGHVALLK